MALVMLQGLQAIRCPAGLYFDIEKQTCDWKDAVKNCKLKNKERKVKPLLYTDEPLCQVGMLSVLWKPVVGVDWTLTMTELSLHRTASWLAEMARV